MGCPPSLEWCLCALCWMGLLASMCPGHSSLAAANTALHQGCIIRAAAADLERPLDREHKTAGLDGKEDHS